MAFCDYETLDAENDLEATDVVHRDHVGENAMLLYSPSQRWYYLDNQLPDDVVLFRHMGSEGQNVACMHESVLVPTYADCPVAGHVAFQKSDHEPQFPRESIEVRVACFAH